MKKLLILILVLSYLNVSAQPKPKKHKARKGIPALVFIGGAITGLFVTIAANKH